MFSQKFQKRLNLISVTLYIYSAWIFLCYSLVKGRNKNFHLLKFAFKSEFFYAVEQNLDENIVLQKLAKNHLHYFIIVAEVGQ